MTTHNKLFAGSVGGVPVLEQGIKANQPQLTSVDMEFMAQRRFQIADIARFYKMPTHKLGTDPGADHVPSDGGEEEAK